MARETGTLFASAGTATGRIHFPVSGKYGIGIRARGTACRGVYPIAELSVNGRPLGSVQLEGDQWQDLGVFGYIPQGLHSVKVAFVNDASNPPREDRNLEVDRVWVSQEQGGDKAIFLTSPPALVAQAYGQGTILFDRLRWDTEKDNSRKAARYACSLLTALEADFMPRSAVTIECEQMTPQADIKYHRTDGSTAYMGCNGYIKTTIQVAETRRYTGEVTAAGDASENICPLIEIRLDGKKLAQVQLTTEGWRSYPLNLDLPQGKHELSIWFLNDHSSPTGDRNLRLDKLVVYND
jgi:hypothetical protein